MKSTFTTHAFLTVHPVILITYSAAISLFYSIYVSLHLSPLLTPPTSAASPHPFSPNGGKTTDGHLHLIRWDRPKRVLVKIPRPTPTDLLTVYWALFWRPLTRAIIRLAGWGLRDFIPDAEDLVLSTEL
ncbi:hypothetical protein F4776DRAFT_649263 [Hypoxylon sp. NC0597]|nr:hypothetical protein F4776DRAFT_649263 [Hypoxylon sp. NC0597]